MKDNSDSKLVMMIVMILWYFFRYKIEIMYETSPDATALQWLTAEQTVGGVHPYLFSQCQVN